MYILNDEVFIDSLLAIKIHTTKSIHIYMYIFMFLNHKRVKIFVEEQSGS